MYKSLSSYKYAHAHTHAHTYVRASHVRRQCATKGCQACVCTVRTHVYMYVGMYEATTKKNRNMKMVFFRLVYIQIYICVWGVGEEQRSKTQRRTSRKTDERVHQASVYALLFAYVVGTGGRVGFCHAHTPYSRRCTL